MEPHPKHPDVAEQFACLLRALNISGSQLAATLGTSQQAISNYTSGRNKPGREILAAIAKRYPSISTSWLLTGEGEPFPAGRYNEKPAPATQSIDSAEPENEARMPATVKRKFDTPMAVARDVEGMTKDEQIAYHKAVAEMLEEELAILKQSQRHEEVVRLVRSAGGQSFTNASSDTADTHEPAAMAVSHRNPEYQRFAPAARQAPERLTIRRWGNS